MEQGNISLKQLMVLVFCGLLSPMIRMIPRETAELAGAGGWLAPLLALPVFLAVLWLLVYTFRRLPRGTSLGGLYQMAYGPVLGRIASLGTVLWLLLLTVLGLRFYAEGFVSSIYRDTDLWLFLVGLMAIVWWITCRGMAAVCRMSQIFFYGLCGVVGLVMLLGIPEVEFYHVWPVWLEGWQGMAASALPVLAVLGHSIPVLFHGDTLGQEQDGLRVASAWLFVLCLVLTALNGIIIGVFGWQTVSRMQLPFFSLAKEGSTLNIVERVESIVAGVWVFSDVALVSAQLLAAVEMTKSMNIKISRPWLLGGMSVLAVLGAVWISPNAFYLWQLWREVVERWDWAVCYALPVLACILLQIKDKRHKI